MTPTATPRYPLSTYRLQLHGGFTFADARRIVPYLHALGITHCYTSSYLKAVPGSTHGYDLIDPTSLNPEVGSEDEHRALVEELTRHGMGHLFDLVPNHMGIGKQVNRWWLDVLENGPSSRYSTFFDIDWHPLKPELEDKVLLPILGDQYGRVLENQEITLYYEAGSFFLRYYDHRLPVAPKSTARILTHRLQELIQQEGAEDPHLQELQSIVTALDHLPTIRERDQARVAERYREKGIIRRRLAAVVNNSPAVAAFLDENVRLINGRRGEPQSFDLLDELLNHQAYRLASWRVAAEEINYRRFFDINELAAVRMENPEVFEEFHQLIFRLITEGAVTGLRVDHVDGLYDPRDYLRRLQAWARETLKPAEPMDVERPLYLIVEKILGPDEPLPETWPVHGTTGYDVLNLINGVFVNSLQVRAFDDAYARFARQRISYDDLIYQTKKLIMGASMSSEINVLGHQLDQLSERDRRSRDFTLNNLTHAIREIIACFPVYRTYVTEDGDVSERDQAYIHRAVAQAKRRNPALSGEVFDFVESLLLKQADERTEADRTERVRFVMKFQQTTSPVTAKGIEDTAFYIYNRLVSLNEVGGEPTRFGVPVDVFHKRMRERQARTPHALTASSTHDTKRSEDVRARINVLSELPQAWRGCLSRWTRLTRKLKTPVDGAPIPDPNVEYLLYQTLLGAWPLGSLDEERHREFCGRIQEYMVKAVREAKLATSWVNPNRAYEEAVQAFVEAVLDRNGPNRFLEDFLPFQEQIARYGCWNSLAQTVLKITGPGVPDFYQGTEVWDFSLVDPDNRRPVDYELRSRLLEELDRALDASRDRVALVQELVKSWTDARIKLYVTMTALRHRREQPALFQEGDYVPLETGGSRKAHLVAFARLRADQAVVVVIPRLVAGLVPDAGHAPVGAEVWGDTWMVVPSWRPGSAYRNVFTGEGLASVTSGDRQTLPLREVLGNFPVALLERMS